MSGHVRGTTLPRPAAGAARIWLDDGIREAWHAPRMLRSRPVVQAAGFTNLLPHSSGRWMLSFTIPGAPPELARERRPQTRHVSRDYPRAMGVRILEGRGFGEQDAAGRPFVVLVNRTLARVCFPGTSPVGTFALFGKTRWTIVGVVDDIRQGALDTAPSRSSSSTSGGCRTPSSRFPMGSACSAWRSLSRRRTRSAMKNSHLDNPDERRYRGSSRSSR